MEVQVSRLAVVAALGLAACTASTNGRSVASGGQFGTPRAATAAPDSSTTSSGSPESSSAPGVPPVAAGSAPDPWAEVDGSGQPLASGDTRALSVDQVDCSGRRDHCLRPWVWFVEGNLHPIPARWTGAAFVRADAPDGRISAGGVAYRTRPATASDLTPGRRVIVYDMGHLPANEVDAGFGDHWSYAEVGTVDVQAGTFTAREDGDTHRIDSARVLVLYWFPGEKAAAVE